MENSHLPVLNRIDEVSVSWIYDRNVERSRLLSRMYRIPFILEASLEKRLGEIDVCLITIPYGARKRHIELCASYNIGIYVEKPFATSVNEHNYYCALFPSYKLAVGFQRRYYSSLAKLSTIISSQLFGKLNQIEFKQGNFSLKGGGGYLSNVDLAGGGVIIESAIHILDQLLIATNSSEVHVNTVKSILKEGIDYDSIFSSEFNTPLGNVVVNCEVSTLRNLENGIELIFDNARIKCQLSPITKFNVRSNYNSDLSFYLEQLEIPDTADSIISSFSVFWQKYLCALREKDGNLTQGKSSLLTTSWIEQIYKHTR